MISSYLRICIIFSLLLFEDVVDGFVLSNNCYRHSIPTGTNEEVTVDSRRWRPLKDQKRQQHGRRHFDNNPIFILRSNQRKRWEDEIEEGALRRMRNTNNSVTSKGDSTSGFGEIAAGAVLGGLLGGPFGAIFGASIGSNFGARNAMSQAKQDEMQRLGLSQDMLDMAIEIGDSLERSYEGLKASKDSLITQQRFARMLENDVNDLYDKAKLAITNNNEQLGKDLLMKRIPYQDKLKDTLIRCVEEKKRIEQMEENVILLERRAMEIESLLRRNVSAKTVQDSSNLGLSLRSEDPLLRKFKDLGID